MDEQEIPLWGITVIGPDGSIPNVRASFAAVGIPPERSVVVSYQDLSRLFPDLHCIRVTETRRMSIMWNRAIRFVAENSDSPLWDLYLADPTVVLTDISVRALRHHMRMLDVGMSQPDVFGTQIQPYKVHRSARLGEVYPLALVTAGERKLLFDPGFYDDSDSWADFCARARVSYGAVLVSSDEIRRWM